ncbi:MAG: hypothetical protein M3071_25505 [Actinomycetota bacterium]|nr:hypothetical protein [Actinomycetota bacterium]
MSLHSADADPGWHGVTAGLARAFGEASPPRVRATRATFVIAADTELVNAWLSEHHPELRLMSAGSTIEIYNEAGPPRRFVERFALDDIGGSHPLG